MNVRKMTAFYPLVLDATSWAGNDGNWSTWPIQVGTPPQQFNVLPATSHGEIWVPLPEGCQSSSTPIFPNASSCGTSRGAGEFGDSQSSGYQKNASTTWSETGIYALPVQDGLFDDDQNGLYGTDIARLSNETGSVEVAEQSVVGLATKDFWIGSLGVAQRAANFTVERAIVPSLLDGLKEQNGTPSAAFGLDVGASYRRWSLSIVNELRHLTGIADNAPGSLIIGGYDRGASEDSGISVSNIANLALTVNARSIVLSNTLQGTVSVTHDLLSLPMVLDSTVSQLWLPRVVCDELETSLGLLYDPLTELYVVNDTAHAKLIELAPTFAFTLAADSTSNETTTVVLPYAALDLQADLPIYNATTNYFPIRRASKRSVLGRAFLQEAYLVVDWERSNFTISPATDRQNRTRDVVTILSPREARSSHTLSVGAIVGIVIGSVIVVVLLSAILWWKCRARKPHKEEPPADNPQRPASWPEDKKIAEVDEPEPAELNPGNTIHPEAMSTPLYELQQEEACHQLIGDPVRFELPAEVAEHELETQRRESRHRSYRPGSEARSLPGERELLE
jgi:hypothetical protein